MKARNVIHTVGPVYHGGNRGEPDLLRSCYHQSLSLASDRGLRTVAFPCISTGVYGYPAEEACEIAVETVKQWLEANPLPEQVVFCCFSGGDEARYRARVEKAR